jgi:hypothetical protein
MVSGHLTPKIVLRHSLDMAQRYYLRTAHKYNMGRGKEESPRQNEVKRNCGCPMSPMG